jgi:PAS domain S-box-containing protein
MITTDSLPPSSGGHLVSSPNIGDSEKSDKLLQSQWLLDKCSDSLIITDLEGMVTSWNQSAEEIFGYSSKDIIGQPITTIIKVIENIPVASIPLDARQSTIMNKRVEGTRKDGTVLWLLVTTKLLLNGKDEPIGIVHRAKDITKLRDIEAELLQSESKYRLLTENVSDVIWTLDLTGHFTYVSPSIFQLRGYTPSEVLQQSITDALTPNSAQKVLKSFQHYWETGVIPTENFEVEQRCKDGTTVWTEVTVTILKDKAGHPESVLGIARNITGRKKADEQIRKNQENNRFIIELFTNALSYTKKELYDYFLAQAVKLSGSKIGFFHLVSEDQQTINLTTWDNDTLKNCNAVYDTHYPIAKAGNWVDCVNLKEPVIYNDFPKSPNQKGLPDGHVPLKRFMSIPIIEDGKVRIIFGVGNKIEPYEPSDAVQIQLVASELYKILKHRQLEDDLRQSEEKYRILVENAADAIMLSDLKGNSIYRNPTYFRQLGLKEGESETFARVHPDDLNLLREKRIELLKNGASTSEYRVLHHEGHWVYRYARSTLIYDQNKDPSSVLSVIRDITQQKEAESKLNDNQAKIQEINEKLRVVGSLTRHDVSNKLSVISNYSYLLRKKYADKPDIVDALNKMEQSVRESAKIFAFAKMYEEIGAKELVYVNVETALNEARALFSGQLPNIINTCQGLRVLADSFLRQLFYNFIDNSLKHGQKTTTIKVTHTIENDTLRLIYEDDGIGISQENKLKLFQQGFSTGASTGFGLFLTKRMIDVYGWTITEAGENGAGVKFIITIPKLNRKSQLNYTLR